MLDVETVLDLRYNIAALCVAVLRDDIAIPEQAFAVLEGKKYELTEKDTWDMVKLHLLEGVTFRELEEIYGIGYSNIHHRITRHTPYKELKELRRLIHERSITTT